MHNFGAFFSTCTATCAFPCFNKMFTFARDFRLFRCRFSKHTQSATYSVVQDQSESNTQAYASLIASSAEKATLCSPFAVTRQNRSHTAEKSSATAFCGEQTRGKRFPGKILSKRACNAASRMRSVHCPRFRQAPCLFERVRQASFRYDISFNFIFEQKSHQKHHILTCFFEKAQNK